MVFISSCCSAVARTTSGGLNRGHKLWCGCLSILNSNWPLSYKHTCSLLRPFPWTELEYRNYWFHTVFNVIALMLLRFIWFPYGLLFLFGFLILTWCLSSNPVNITVGVGLNKWYYIQHSYLQKWWMGMCNSAFVERQKKVVKQHLPRNKHLVFMSHQSDLFNLGREKVLSDLFQ